MIREQGNLDMGRKEEGWATCDRAHAGEDLSASFDKGSRSKGKSQTKISQIVVGLEDWFAVIEAIKGLTQFVQIRFFNLCGMRSARADSTVSENWRKQMDEGTFLFSQLSFL